MASKINSENRHVITLIPGDGIGPEVTKSACDIIKAAGVNIEWEVCEAGAEVFKRGLATGVPQETIESIQRNRVALKGPLMTPIGFGEKSANVTLRKLFETFGNIRPVREIPGVVTPYSGRGIDLVIVRENVEDLYAGIEYMETPGVSKAIKLITRKGCEKIVRLAFEFARSEGRKNVACASKSNIMKLSEGMLKRTFEEIAKEYPDINAEHVIVDNCAHQLVKKPEQFDVIVTTNMNGDILSDLSSALVGGLGFAPGANIGNDVAIFEAVHGSAPKYAGKNVINPTAVLLSATMMLRYIGEFRAADSIEQAIMVTYEQGKAVPRDVPGVVDPASTTDFTAEVIKNLGKKPSKWNLRPYRELAVPVVDKRADFVQAKKTSLVGVDISVESSLSADALGKSIEKLVASLPCRLSIISSRGVKVYPSAGVSPDVVDAWRCRFVMRDGKSDMTDNNLRELLEALQKKHSWSGLEKLPVYDGSLGYTKSQGEE